MESLHSVVKYQSSSDALLTSQTIEKAFPELRESEDEKIRKAQLNYWRSVGGKEWYGVPVQETIAWFEKQAVQKSWSEEEKTRKAILELVKQSSHILNPMNQKSMISWLEKQDNIPHFTFDDILALQCAMKATEKADNELYEQLKSLHDRLHDVYWLEKAKQELMMQLLKIDEKYEKK